MHSQRKKVPDSIEGFDLQVNHNSANMSEDKKFGSYAVLEKNITFLMKISKEAQLPITQYFLEKALESLLTIETKKKHA